MKKKNKTRIIGISEIKKAYETLLGYKESKKTLEKVM